MGQLELRESEGFRYKVTPTSGTFDTAWLNILYTLGFCRASVGLLEFVFVGENHLMKLCNPPQLDSPWWNHEYVF